MTKLTNQRMHELWDGINNTYGPNTFYAFTGMDVIDWIGFGVRCEDTIKSAYKKVRRGIDRKIAQKAYGWYSCDIPGKCEGATDCNHAKTCRPEQRLIRACDTKIKLKRFNQNIACESCIANDALAKNGAWCTVGEKDEIGLCTRHLTEYMYFEYIPFEFYKHDHEELRLNYCKKCGDRLDDHDTSICLFEKYPAIAKLPEYEAELNVAKQYGIDISTANAIIADDGRHGTQECDLKMDIIFSYVTWKHESESNESNMNFYDYTKEHLRNWGYEDNMFTSDGLNLIRKIQTLHGLQ